MVGRVLIRVHCKCRKFVGWLISLGYDQFRMEGLPRYEDNRLKINKFQL